MIEILINSENVSYVGTVYILRVCQVFDTENDVQYQNNRVVRYVINVGRRREENRRAVYSQCPVVAIIQRTAVTVNYVHFQIEIVPCDGVVVVGLA